MKAILILMAFIGAFCFTMVVMTATPNDREQYEAYMKWKERKKNGKAD